MSTRSTVQFFKGSTPVAKYYHHWDGYLSGVGMRIQQALYAGMDSNNYEKIMDAINTLDKGGFEKEDLATRHGDTEYHYKIILSDDLTKEPCKVYCYKCWGGEGETIIPEGWFEIPFDEMNYHYSNEDLDALDREHEYSPRASEYLYNLFENDEGSHYSYAVSYHSLLGNVVYRYAQKFNKKALTLSEVGLLSETTEMFYNLLLEENEKRTTN